MKKIVISLFGFILLSLSVNQTVHAQDGFIGEVRLFAGNFAPRGWMECKGQILPISSNSALFSILGTTFGGDGRTTFALPNLNAMPSGSGSAPAPSTSESPSGGSATGGGKVVPKTSGSNMPGVRYIICVNGVFPSRG